MLCGSTSAVRLTAALKCATAVAAIAVVLLFSFAWLRLSPPTTHSSPLITHPSAIHAWQGVASCSAMPCHHSGERGAKAGNELTVWFSRDAHSRAYEVLTQPAARDVNRRLRRAPDPYRDDLCLRCHVDPHWQEAALSPRFSLSDGVGCESCHGPAQKWLARHYRKDLAESERREGMRDTRSLAGRVRLCLDCHVGAPGQDVNHDLIAAGHPALRFEFATYHGAMPHHWDDRRTELIPFYARGPRGQDDFDARAQVLGDLAAGQAALRLLADRASALGRPWPEFAEYDCASCHHDLQGPRSRQTQWSVASGQWPVKTSPHWPLATAVGRIANPSYRWPLATGHREICRQLKDIKRLLETWNSPRRAVAEQASRLAQQLEPSSPSHE